MALVRVLLLARLVGAENFGIGATFIMCVSLLQLLSDLAVDRYLVQSESGDDPEVQASAQSIFVLRGIVSSLLLFAAAGPLSVAFKLPDVLWAYRCLAVVPLIRGFAHLDPRREQRRMNYRPAVTAELLSEIVATVIAVPLAWAARSYETILVVLVLRASLFTLCTHLVSTRVYELGWSPVHARLILKFAWPLMVNGILVFIMQQGDQAVVGTLYSKATLGAYAAAFTLTMTPLRMMTRVTTPLLLPLMSRTRDSVRELKYTYSLSCQLLAVIATGVCGFFAVGGRALLRVSVGEGYTVAHALVVFLAARHGLKALRTAVNSLAISRGRTRDIPMANMLRVLALGAAVYAGIRGMPIYWIAVCSFFGELTSLIWISAIVRSSVGVRMRSVLVPAGAICGATTVAATVGHSLSHCESFGLDLAVAAVVGPVMSVAVLLAMPELRAELRGWPERIRLKMAERGGKKLEFSQDTAGETRANDHK